MHPVGILAVAAAIAVAPLVAQAEPATAARQVSAAPVTLATWCKKLVVRLPEVSSTECENSGMSATGARSLQGFPLLARHIAASPDAKRRPVRVLLMGGIHGDELTSSSIVFNWLQWLGGPLASQFEWRVMPVVNPDGLLAHNATRVNANGVDLNRNFPTPDWEHDAPRYWQVRTHRDPRRFPGAAPLSEPESRWVNEEMLRFRPDVIISVHAPFGVLDFDGPSEPPRKFGRLLLDRVGVYPGSLGNYGGVHKNVPVITIELPNALRMPTRAEQWRIWVDMLVWMSRNVERRNDQMAYVVFPQGQDVVGPAPAVLSEQP
ncbi:MAG TPA: M14 family zinc carboxypeptidase [Oxalicibacterium sp.]